MDFAKEFEVKIEILDNDWSNDFVDIVKTEPEAIEDISVDERQLINIARCQHCNEVFIDSTFLFKHNLTHLFVTIDKLPGKILAFYDLPESSETLSDEIISEETQNTSETLSNDKVNDVSIKCEIVEYNSETNEISDGEDTKTDLLVKIEDNNNDIPISKRMYKCDICSKEYTYKHWHAHMNEVHSKINITCKLCKKEYKSKKSLRKHSCSAKPKEKAVATFKCSQCISVFYSKDCMQKHVKNVHSKPVECEICHSRLNSQMYLTSHMRRVHYDDGKVHSCDLCGKIFKSPNYVKIHMKNSHSNNSKRKKKQKDVIFT